MQPTNSDLATAAQAATRLDVSFLLASDGSISRASEALLQRCSQAMRLRPMQLSDLIADAPDANHLMQWLHHSRGYCALSLQTRLLAGAGKCLVVELLATAMPTHGSRQAFCAVRLPQRLSTHAAELAHQIKRQSAVLQQQRQDQAALLDSEFRWRFAMEGSGEGVWDWDVRTGEAYFSPLWKRLIGYADSQISSRFEEWRDRIHPDDLDRVLAALNRYLESDSGSYRLEFRMRCQDGSYAWIRSRGMAAVRDRDGLPLRIIGTHKNITGATLHGLSQKMADQKLADQKTQLSQLVAQTEAARESERKHIAREVHDELGQILTALRMDASFIALRFGSLDAALNSKILDMRALVDSAIQGVRDVAARLRPTALDMGLYLALEWLCNDFVKRTGTPCLLDSMDHQIELDESRSVVVFRIVQESLTNVSRYAQASQVFVTLGLGDNELEVEVQDNGVGFEPDQVERGNTFGLLGMRERALALGGRLDISSAPGQGTTIAVAMPYDRRLGGAQP